MPTTTDPQRRTLWLLLALAAARLLLHLFANVNYGFHRDELAVWDDAHRLAWGYVAYPPLTPALAHLSLAWFGDSLAGFRLFAALAQCTAMVLTGLIARELGGGRWAQVLAALAMAAIPGSLLSASVMQYVAIDFLWWVLLGWLVLRLVNSGEPRWWLGIGAVIGLGMLTKYTILFWVAGIVVGTLATPLRRHLRSPWLWAGVALSLLLFLPNAWWQWQHDFISLDFLQSIHARDIRIGRTDGFLSDQLHTVAHPFTLPLWLAGLGWLVLSREGKRYRVLAWMYVVPLLLFVFAHGRSYYMQPAYPMLLAAGTVAVASWLTGLKARNAAWIRGAVTAVVLLALGISLALGLPLAPVGSAGWQFSRRFHDMFAEQIGWPEYVAAVAAIYHALPPNERAHTAIFANNYGEAGAVNLYGPKYGLPRAISTVNSYWYLGYGKVAPTTVIVLGDTPEGSAGTPATCTLAGRVRIPHGVQNEESGHPDIFVCRNFRVPISKLWPPMPNFG